MVVVVVVDISFFSGVLSESLAVVVEVEPTARRFMQKLLFLTLMDVVEKSRPRTGGRTGIRWAASRGNEQSLVVVRSEGDGSLAECRPECYNRRFNPIVIVISYSGKWRHGQQFIVGLHQVSTESSAKTTAREGTLLDVG